MAERLKRALRTQEDEFRIPILQDVVDVDGSAPMTKVLDKVVLGQKKICAKKLKDVF